MGYLLDSVFILNYWKSIKNNNEEEKNMSFAWKT